MFRHKIIPPLFLTLLSPPMGCKQSKIVPYAEITEEDKKLIPTLFRDINYSYKSRGVEYWWSTCFVKEGTVPIKIGVRSREFVYWIGQYIRVRICVCEERWILS